jgi:hypothetical protein
MLGNHSTPIATSLAHHALRARTGPVSERGAGRETTRMKATLIAAAALLFGSSDTAIPQEVALLLFDGEHGRQFLGCLNCSPYDGAAICNQFGEFGSPYEALSVWNEFGQYGSPYEMNSPWNPYGEGLRIVDQQGNYYGRFTVGYNEPSGLPSVQSIVSIYNRAQSIDVVRRLLCE